MKTTTADSTFYCTAHRFLNLLLLGVTPQHPSLFRLVYMCACNDCTAPNGAQPDVHQSGPGPQRIPVQTHTLSKGVATDSERIHSSPPCKSGIALAQYNFSSVWEIPNSTTNQPSDSLPLLVFNEAGRHRRSGRNEELR